MYFIWSARYIMFRCLFDFNGKIIILDLVMSSESPSINLDPEAVVRSQANNEQ